MNIPVNRHLLPLILVTIAALSACKKKQVTPSDDGGGTNTPATRFQLSQDSLFLYAKEVYYWNDGIPSYTVFNPRKYTSLSTDFQNLSKELFDITQLKINPTTGLPYEYYSPAPTYSKYSYMTESVSNGIVIASPNTISDIDSEGVGDDYGVEFAGAGSSNSSYSMYILVVVPSSPFAKAGISRGDIIRKVNGTTLGTNYPSDYPLLANALTQSTVSLEILKKSKETVTLSLTKAKYTTTPILKDSVYTSGTHKIGYMAYYQFTSPSNSTPAFTKSFKRFSDEGVTDLIVDLRYNGGGSGASAEQLSNMIVPSSANGSVMYARYYNSTMQSGQASILSNQIALDLSGKPQTGNNGQPLRMNQFDYSVAGNTVKYNKQGPLTALQKVVFLVSGNTASASELVINNLKPYMDVKLVGATTYGKPIGFPIIKIDKYYVFYSMIALKNSAGQGDYFAGFTPDKTAVEYIDLDWGDPRDEGLKSAFSYIASGNFTSTPVVTGRDNDVHILDAPVTKFHRNLFQGVVFDNLPVKK